MNQRSSAGNTWNDQDEAFFGSVVKDKTLNYCEPCKKTNTNEPSTSTNHHPMSSIVGIQKQRLAHVANSASKKVKNLLDKKKHFNGSNPWSMSNIGPNTNDSVSSHRRDTTTTTTVANNPSLSNIGRVVQNALVSQIPLRCAHCHSIPMMYQTHPFFGPVERICSTHPLNRIVRCVSCQRFQPKNTLFAQIGTSSARICPICARTAILHNEAAKDLYKDILVFMEETNGLEVFDDMHHIPILLVNEDALNGNSSSIGCDANEQKRGLCVWSEQHFGLPVNPMDVVGAARGMFQHWSGNHAAIHRGNSKTSDHLRNTRAGWRKVTIQSIYVLKGLPRNLMASILAHESMHAWLGLHPIRRDGVVGEDTSFGTVRRIEPIIEEGICQLVAYLYLQHIISNEESTESDRTFFFSGEPTDSKLNQYFLWAIENHSSPVYGEGFHKAFSAYRHICEQGGGLKDLMTYIVIHRDFPPSH